MTTAMKRTMRATIYGDADALYARFTDLPVASGKRIDDTRHMDLSKDGKVVGIEFLYISQGIDLRGISEPYRTQLNKELPRTIKVLV